MLTGTAFDDLRAVVILYLEGMIWGEPDKLRQAFHPKAHATGHEDGIYYHVARDAFIAEWQTLATLPPGTPYTAEITLVDVTGDVALVKVTNTCFGNDYTDYLTLVKSQTHWQITHKAWFTHPKSS